MDLVIECAVDSGEHHWIALSGDREILYALIMEGVDSKRCGVAALADGFQRWCSCLEAGRRPAQMPALDPASLCASHSNVVREGRLASNGAAQPHTSDGF